MTDRSEVIGKEMGIARVGGGDNLAVTLLLGSAALALGLKTYLTTPFDPLFETEGTRQNVDPNLLRAIARHESNFKPFAINTNRNGSRDIGLMQINEKTAAALDVDPKSLLNAQKNIETAAKLLARMRSELGSLYSYSNIVSAYNVGTPTVRRSGIVNPAYVGAVTFHHMMYSIGRVLA